jgi:hypothetical protein
MTEGQGAIMTIEQLVIEKLRELSPDKQKEVLEYVESLKADRHPEQPFLSPEGLWADLGFDITADDIAQARREMWGKFPRDIS